MIFFSIIERDQHGIDYQKKFFSIKYQCESRSMTREKKKEVLFDRPLLLTFTEKYEQDCFELLRSFFFSMIKQ
jgi:hypothetical protein